MTKVGLFVTCLVDLYRPSVGFAALKLLEQAGCEVKIPLKQTCCAQPAYNNGDKAKAIEIAKQVIIEFEDFEYIIVPSGSCAAMLCKHYPLLFENDDDWSPRAINLANKTREILTFLANRLDLDELDSSISGKLTYHDSCSGLREIGVSEQPRKLLSKFDQLQLTEMNDSDVCCGFGGTFCVKYPDISQYMVSEKLRNIKDTGADMVVGGDLGCLLNIAGRARREGLDLQVRHVLEILANALDHAPIGQR